MTAAKTLILDWGIGGISVLQKLYARKRSLDFIYHSDTGFVPYGKVPRAELSRRLETIIDYFSRTAGIENCLIACNAASTVAPELRARIPALRIFDIISPTRPEIQKLRSSHLLLIGGQRTVRSRAYGTQRDFAAKKYSARSTQALSAFVENGEHASPACENYLHKIFVGCSPQHLVMACTHYPALTEQLRKQLPGIRLVDPADFMVRNFLSTTRPARGHPRGQFFTSGSVREMKRSADRAFGFYISEARVSPLAPTRVLTRRV